MQVEGKRRDGEDLEEDTHATRVKAEATIYKKADRVGRIGFPVAEEITTVGRKAMMSGEGGRCIRANRRSPRISGRNGSNAHHDTPTEVRSPGEQYRESRAQVEQKARGAVPRGHVGKASSSSERLAYASGVEFAKSALSFGSRGKRVEWAILAVVSAVDVVDRVVSIKSNSYVSSRDIFTLNLLRLEATIPSDGKR